MQCPFGIWLGLSKDGQQLCVTKMTDQHNHETEKVTFENLPKRRKLSDPQEKQVKRLLELHGNKWLIQAVWNGTIISVLAYLLHPRVRGFATNVTVTEYGSYSQ